MTKNIKNIPSASSQTLLFKAESPLAYRIRPSLASDLIGQNHLLGENGVLTNYLKNNLPYSIILWGPPGTGKTSIAMLATNISKSEFISLCGASTSVSEIRDAINQSKINFQRTILFIDEIHRLAKNQQDVLLEPVESGQIILIGTTTENPHISITRALHSRVKILELKPHTKADLKALINRALSHKDGFPNYKITEKASEILISSASGDARRLLFNLEEAVKISRDNLISEETIQKILDNSQLQIGADPENYYNCISALQKSIRGSDVNASLYWLGRLLEGGTDPTHVARRVLVTASEDIGLADNNALNIAVNAYQCAMFLGMPEARIPLSQAVIYLAKAPKSNTAIVSIDKVLKDIRDLPLSIVPIYLRNTGGEGYKYPHSYKDLNTGQNYLPEELLGKKYFEPNERDKIK